MSEFPGGRKLPPAVELLGYRLLAADAERGEAYAEFVARPEFLNLMGNVQGGFLTAMLDAVAATALLAQLPADQLAPTLELKSSFIRPAPAGRILGSGRVVHRGKTIAFLEGELTDEDGALLATATATVRIVRT